VVIKVAVIVNYKNAALGLAVCMPLGYLFELLYFRGAAIGRRGSFLPWVAAALGPPLCNPQLLVPWQQGLVAQ
jgi:hypothetical protein